MEEWFSVGILVFRWNTLDCGRCGSGGLVFSVFRRNGLLLVVLGIHVNGVFGNSGLVWLRNFRRRFQTLGSLLLIARLTGGEVASHVDRLRVVIDGAVHFKVVELNFETGHHIKMVVNMSGMGQFSHHSPLQSNSNLLHGERQAFAC